MKDDSLTPAVKAEKETLIGNALSNVKDQISKLEIVFDQYENKLEPLNSGDGEAEEMKEKATPYFGSSRIINDIDSISNSLMALHKKFEYLLKHTEV